jgi:hypothetical protein
MIKPGSTKEITRQLASLLENKIKSAGFAPLHLKNEPLTFIKPGADNTSLVVRVNVNGWRNREYYLTVVIGVNEPTIARLFLKAATMGGVSHRSLMLCGHFIQEYSKRHSELRVKSWPLKDWSNYVQLVDAIAGDIAKTTRSLYGDCISLPGLYNVLKHFEDYPQIRMHDHYLMKLLVPICEFHMTDIERAKETIAENVKQLKKMDSRISSANYLTALKFILEHGVGINRERGR